MNADRPYSEPEQAQIAPECCLDPMSQEEQPIRRFEHRCECKCGCNAILPREQFWWRMCNPCCYRASIDGIRPYPGREDWDSRCKGYVEPEPQIQTHQAPEGQLGLF